MSITVLDAPVVYDNPTPTLTSRHGYFPTVVVLPSRELLCLFVLGEAFESVDQTTWLTRSTDNGQTWKLQGPLYDKSCLDHPTNDFLKATLLSDGRLIAMGYRFDRSNPGHVLVNPETDGVRPGDVVTSFSDDDGRTWSVPETLTLSRPDLLEISGPCIQLPNGDLLAGGPAMPAWDSGTTTCGHDGILLRSKDGGDTWDDSTRYFTSSENMAGPLETRFTQMTDGRIVGIVWALNYKTGRNMANQIVVSTDNGQTWSQAIDSGIPAQASSVLAREDNILLSVHAQREGEDVGLYVRVLELCEDRVNILDESKIWGNAPSKKIGSFQEMSASLRFGQPSLTPLPNGDILATFWAIENGQGRILGYRLKTS